MPEFYGPDESFKFDLLFGIESDTGGDNALKKFVKQRELEMISHRIDKGVLSDSYTFIFVEIDLKKFHIDIQPHLLAGANISPRDIPIKYKIKSNHPGGFTVREFMLGFIYDAYRKENELNKVREDMVDFEKYYLLSKSYSNTNTPERITNLSDTENPETESNVYSSTKQNDLNMLYGLDCDRLLRISRQVFRELEIRNINYLDHSLDTSSIFSESTCSTLPSSHDGTFSRE